MQRAGRFRRQCGGVLNGTQVSGQKGEVATSMSEHDQHDPTGAMAAKEDPLIFHGQTDFKPSIERTRCRAASDCCTIPEVFQDFMWCSTA